MNHSDIQSKIQAAAAQFTSQMVALFGEAFASVASELASAAPAKAKAVAKKAPAKKAPAKALPKPAAKAAPAKKVAPAAKKAAPAPKKVAPAAKKAAPAPKKAAVKPAKPGKRIRRSENQLQEDGDRVVKLLAANKKGLRIEQINKQLGTATKQLARPIMKLLSEGKIKKSGEKRATLYFPA